MDFPSSQLIILLDCVRGKHPWDSEALGAALDVLRYAIHTFGTGPHIIGDSEEFDPEKAIEEILASEASEAKQVGPGLWISLGIWIAKIIIERLASK